MQKTPEQLAVVDAAKDSTKNLLVVARAGAGKTTTIKMISEVLDPNTTLILAFNKAIAEELQNDPSIDDMYEIRTINSWGSQFLRDKFGFCKLNYRKHYEIALSVLNLETQAHNKSLTDDERALIRSAENCLYWMLTNGYPFADDTIPEEYQDLPYEQLLDQCIYRTKNKQITFEDQIYYPAYLYYKDKESGTNWMNSYYKTLLVDEAQDLSKCDSYLAGCIADRIIAVGDDKQAIYGFRGADENSMDNLATTYDMIELPLSHSFRCSTEVVKQAQILCPDLKTYSKQEGETGDLGKFSFDKVKPNSAVLAPLNSIVFGLAIVGYLEGYNVAFKDSSFAKKILNAHKNIGVANYKQIAAKRMGLNKYLKKREEEAMYKLLLELSNSKPYNEVTDMLKDLEARTDSQADIYFSTIHRAKGLEWENVYLVDLDEVDKLSQSDNLRYVAITRAITNLYYCSTETSNDY